ncbi:MAG: hypothetical protein COV30_01680 [Candidatus Yanofskybacteria bacterium CG10_big_fil_rev_8_21_14_0_10_37_15]|uniref:VTT domain-containing protein n=1 Tax=Candidatus Yanofskybacteria bacterium CG10_big_fil_rev_8_21_14_0_10_37_15 TaxID=1975097 RepID=A0A2H0R5T4_9BACT|nr:MAG: hypothetical protein COV30_01680 [Candidatus Yanofskybacteria bacterium CG10_big_fil_rev_8_21_14_0_10_37_15]
MENILQFIQDNLPWLIEHKYVFIFLGVAVEGINTTILAGFLASIGAVALWPAFLLALAGQIINASGWYTVGYFAGSKPIDKWGRKDEKSRRIIEKVEHYFKRYSGRAIFIAHITWSLTIATMVMAGSFKYNFKKFTLYNFFGSSVWVLMVFFVGYFFGQSYRYLFDYFKNIIIGILFLGGAIAVGYILKMIFRLVYVRFLFFNERLKKLHYKMRDHLNNFFSDKNSENGNNKNLS